MPSSSTRRPALVAAVLAASLALPGLASAAAAPEMMGSTLGKTSDEVTASLKSMGYEVRRFETEDGMIEGYALKDGKRFEVYVDPATGKVSRFKESN